MPWFLLLEPRVFDILERLCIPAPEVKEGSLEGRSGQCQSVTRPTHACPLSSMLETILFWGRTLKRSGMCPKPLDLLQNSLL